MHRDLFLILLKTGWNSTKNLDWRTLFNLTGALDKRNVHTSPLVTSSLQAMYLHIDKVVCMIYIWLGWNLWKSYLVHDVLVNKFNKKCFIKLYRKRSNSTDFIPKEKRWIEKKKILNFSHKYSEIKQKFPIFSYRKILLYFWKAYQTKPKK